MKEKEGSHTSCIIPVSLKFLDIFPIATKNKNKLLKLIIIIF